MNWFTVFSVDSLLDEKQHFFIDPLECHAASRAKDGRDVQERAEVAGWIAGDGDEVRVFASLDRTFVLGNTTRLGADRRRGGKRFDVRQTRTPQKGNAVRQH